MSDDKCLPRFLNVAAFPPQPYHGHCVNCGALMLTQRCERCAQSAPVKSAEHRPVHQGFPSLANCLTCSRVMLAGGVCKWCSTGFRPVPASA